MNYRRSLTSTVVPSLVTVFTVSCDPTQSRVHGCAGDAGDAGVWVLQVLWWRLSTLSVSFSWRWGLDGHVVCCSVCTVCVVVVNGSCGVQWVCGAHLLYQLSRSSRGYLCVGGCGAVSSAIAVTPRGHTKDTQSPVCPKASVAGFLCPPLYTAQRV